MKVVILWYNKVSETRECVRSVLAGGVPERDVILWDNGSHPEHADKIREMFPCLVHGRSETNRGFSGGCNDALRYAWEYDDVVLFLTNDTRLLSYDEKLIRSLMRETHGAMLAPLIVYDRDRTKIDSYGGWFEHETVRLFHYRQRDLPFLLGENDYIPGTALWMTRTAFERIKGIDESYFTYWEDVDMSFRARQAGVLLGRDGSTRIAHRVGKTCHGQSLYTTYYYQRNRCLFVSRFLSDERREQAYEVIARDVARQKQEAHKKGDGRRLVYLSEIERWCEKGVVGE